MTNDVATRLREALVTRAEYGMQTTDTDRELVRLQSELHRNANRRRRAIAAVGVAAAAIIGGAVVLAVNLTGNDTSRSRIGHQPPAATGKLPAGLPAVTFQRSSSAVAGQLTLNNDGTATLSDQSGSNREALSLAAPGTLRFDPPADRDYCTVTGSYRYTLTAGSLVFTKVADSCAARVQFLTMSPWAQLTGTVAGVPQGFPTGRLEVANSPTHVAMTVSSDGGVTLSDNRGDSRETLSFLTTGQVTFSKDDFFCSVAGTYRYTTTTTTVRFALVHDTCRDRRIFLTAAAFTKTG
jgi:hypothetical protein